jgi:hypothetical protein
MRTPEHSLYNTGVGPGNDNGSSRYPKSASVPRETSARVHACTGN